MNDPEKFWWLGITLFVLGFTCGTLGLGIGLASWAGYSEASTTVWSALALGGIVVIVFAILAVWRSNRLALRRMAVAKPTRSRLTGIMESYAHARPKDTKKTLRNLQTYIAGIENMGSYGIGILSKRSQTIREAERRNKLLPALQAEIFNVNVRKEDFLYASDFCPRCNTFKNYDKECPDCGLLELTL